MKRKNYCILKWFLLDFLTYYDGKISIPNTELKEKFIEVLKSNNYLKFFLI